MLNITFSDLKSQRRLRGIKSCKIRDSCSCKDIRTKKAVGCAEILNFDLLSRAGT